MKTVKQAEIVKFTLHLVLTIAGILANILH